MALISLNKVGIDLPIYDADHRILRKSLFKRRTGGVISSDSGVVVRALRDITLHIEDGDRVGLVGANGSGKTTLLRVMAGVYAPTGGTVDIRGRVSALLSPGLGMDLEDTGFDNIRNVGIMLGMSHQEIERKTEDVARFTELGEYLALPVRIYSSGMQLRLAFAIVTAIEPEILLLDEGLGAGDARFAERAQRRVDALIERSSVMVIATHSTGVIEQMCNRAVLLEQGRIVAQGPVREVLEAYQTFNSSAPEGEILTEPVPIS